MKLTNLPGGVVRSEIEFRGDDDGSEYESIGTRHWFKDAAEMTKAMKDPAYKTSQSYRNLVKQMIGKSDPVALGLAPDRSNAREGEFYKAKMASARELFSDPRYKTDARYREYVRQMCASEEAEAAFPELSQAEVDRKQGGFAIQYHAKETGRVNPNAKRDSEGNLKSQGDE